MKGFLSEGQSERVNRLAGILGIEDFKISNFERFAQQNLTSGMCVRLWERVIVNCGFRIAD